MSETTKPNLQSEVATAITENNFRHFQEQLAATNPRVHTATPWIAVFDKKETRITPEWGQFRLATLESDGHAQDAAYIVHCVNSHAQLVAALRAMVSDIDRYATEQDVEVRLWASVGTAKHLLATEQESGVK